MRRDVFTLAKESADLAFDMSPCHSEERDVSFTALCVC